MTKEVAENGEELHQIVFSWRGLGTTVRLPGKQIKIDCVTWEVEGSLNILFMPWKQAVCLQVLTVLTIYTPTETSAEENDENEHNIVK